MEEGAGADHFALAGKGDAAFADTLFEILDRLEVGIDQRLVNERPKVFGGLQLGTMRRPKHEPDAIRYSQVFWPMPSGAIELKDDPLVCASARRFGEVQKNALEQLLSGALPHDALLERTLQTAFETFHTVAPVAGSTNPQT